MLPGIRVVEVQRIAHVMAFTAEGALPVVGGFHQPDEVSVAVGLVDVVEVFGHVTVRASPTVAGVDHQGRVSHEMGGMTLCLERGKDGLVGVQGAGVRRTIRRGVPHGAVLAVLGVHRSVAEMAVDSLVVIGVKVIDQSVARLAGQPSPRGMASDAGLSTMRGILVGYRQCRMPDRVTCRLSHHAADPCVIRSRRIIEFRVAVGTVRSRKNRLEQIDVGLRLGPRLVESLRSQLQLDLIFLATHPKQSTCHHQAPDHRNWFQQGVFSGGVLHDSCFVLISPLDDRILKSMR